MSVVDLILRISDDGELLEQFCNLENLEDVKKFIKELDNAISDEDIEDFINNNIYDLSELSLNELQGVSGGAINKKLLSFPLAILSAVSMVSNIPDCMAAATITSSGNAIVKQEKEEKVGFGKKIWEKFKSNTEVENSVDKYKAAGFLQQPTKTKFPNDMESRQEVFFDTLNYCMENSDKFSIEFDAEDFTSTNSKTVNYDHNKFLAENKNDKVANKKPSKIWLTNGRSLQSLNAVNFRLGIKTEDTKNTAVLNFANYYVPGGGVIQGCTAQEESLCRITTLYPNLATKSMKDEFYKKHTIIPTNMDEWKESGIFNEAIYTTDIKQIKEDYGIGRVGEYIDGATFNVITAAAPDFRDFDLDKADIDKYRDGMKDLWRMILAIAYKNGDKNLVLGALGCGAFKNDPNIVAETFYDVITEIGPGGNKWAYCFDNIIMPIFTSNKNDKKNYDAFKQMYDEKYKSLSNEPQEEIDLPSIL